VCINIILIFIRDNSEDSSYRGSPPWQLLQGLEKNRLIISDCEVADVDIPVLVKFFQTKQVSFPSRLTQSISYDIFYLGMQRSASNRN
jgi:hypothetical protein